MTNEEKIEALRETSEEALLADGLDEALLGVAYVFGKPPVAAYDYDKCLRIFMDQGMTHEEAEEWMSFNVTGAYVGKGTPIYIRTFDGEEG